MPTSKRKRQGTDKLPFAKTLSRLMNERGLSIGAVAEMAGVSRSVVQSWTAQAVPHDLLAVGRLAKALNINFRELLLGEAEPESIRASSINDLFDEKEFFEGICRLNIQRLVPKKGKPE